MTSIKDLPEDVGAAFREALSEGFYGDDNLQVREDLRLLLCDLGEIFDGTCSGNLNQAVYNLSATLGEIHPAFSAAEMTSAQRAKLQSRMNIVRGYTRAHDDVAKTVDKVLKAMQARFIDLPKPIFTDVSAKRNGKPVGSIKTAFHGAGLTSYEDLDVEKIEDGKLYLMSDDGPSEQFVFDMATGQCIKDPTDGFAGFSRTINAADFKPS